MCEADARFTRRVQAWLAERYGEELEHPDCPPELRAAVLERMESSPERPSPGLQEMERVEDIVFEAIRSSHYNRATPWILEAGKAARRILARDLSAGEEEARSGLRGPHVCGECKGLCYCDDGGGCVHECAGSNQVPPMWNRIRPEPSAPAAGCYSTRGYHGRRDADGRCVDCGERLPPGPPDSPPPPTPDVA